MNIGSIVDPSKYSLAMGPFGSNIKTDNFVPSGIPIIRGGNISSGRFIESGFVYLTQEKADELISANAFPGDIIFTHRGTLGQVGIIPINSKYPRYVVSQSQMKLRVDHTKADPNFVYYFFKSPEGQRKLLINTSTTGVPAISSPLSSLRNIRIPLPPLPEQRAIAEVLSALDDKIELNRRMNQTLEQLAIVLFNDWFINNPEDNGWEEISLDMLASFLNGLALQKYPPVGDEYLPVIKIAQLRTNNTVNADKASAQLDPVYVVNDGDVLFSWSGSLEVVLWSGGRGALNQHLFKVNSKTYPKWLYYLWIKHHLPDFRSIAAGKATTMGHIQRHHLADAKVIVPPTSTLQSMTEIMEPLIEKIIANNIESRILAELRDTLLPKLMSGQVRVTGGLSGN